ncbi:MAG: 4-hydroxythreonine-4-phosphate dehydrogenase PdxA [Rhodocyclales bacterium]|nr:4-hydroxythreonine-4-phosphate dehydrogenase PdxA [Rhodocyclales bacterium]
MKPIAITTGEPAGVGPELCARLADRLWPAPLVLIGDRGLLAERGVPPLPEFDPGAPAPLSIRHVPLRAPSKPGLLEPANAPYVLEVLDTAIDGMLDGTFDALVTAPIQKSLIAASGRPFTGHTEYLAERSGTPLVVMMLVGAGLRVALVTTHLPLAEVPAAVTPQRLEAVLRILDRDLRRRFGIPQPCILVAGLNPHAGESGHLGHEEREVITPVLERLRAEGMTLVGPLPADTLFTPRVIAGSDAQLAMYHDQGLPVLKYASFGNGVNVTLGLPFIRTSVDHGTALDLAGTGRADPGSLFEAVTLACLLASVEERLAAQGERAT